MSLEHSCLCIVFVLCFYCVRAILVCACVVFLVYSYCVCSMYLLCLNCVRPVFAV